MAEVQSVLLFAVGGLAAIQIVVCVLGHALVGEIAQLAKRVDKLDPEGADKWEE
jgi:D-arabinose 1-dehydrogenase-like Zn-dependent alcohol dehydrogenase